MINISINKHLVFRIDFSVIYLYINAVEVISVNSYKWIYLTHYETLFYSF